MKNLQPPPAAPNPTISEVHRAYMLAQAASNVVRRYQASLDIARRMFTELHGDLPLADVTPDHIRRWLLWLRGEGDQPRATSLAQSSIATYYRYLKGFFAWAENEGYVTRSPAKSVKAVKTPKTIPDVLTEDEAMQLLLGVKNDGDRNSYRDYAIILFFLDTGVRVSELAALRMGALNLEAGYAKIFGKGRKERIVPLGLELRQVIAKYITRHRLATAGEDTLFTNERGRRMLSKGIQTMVKRALADNIKRDLYRGGPHTLRHTFATLDLRHGHDIKRTSLVLGHTSTTITERYTHLTGDDVLIAPGGSHIDRLIRQER